MVPNLKKNLKRQDPLYWIKDSLKKQMKLFHKFEEKSEKARAVLLDQGLIENAKKIVVKLDYLTNI